MVLETLIVLAAVAVGCLGFFMIGRYSSFFSKHLVLIVIGVPFAGLVVFPSAMIVLPFVGKEIRYVPVIVESIGEYRGSGTYRPGRHGRVIELGFDTLTLSSVVDAMTVTDTWTIPSGFGPFGEGKTYEGIVAGTGDEAQLAVRSVIEFPFTFGQLLTSLVPGAIFFAMFASWVHDRRNKKSHP